jgi:hypothetical protein
MPTSANETERDRAIVRQFYEGGGRDEFSSFADRIAEDFQVFVPGYLPWGGQSDKQRYINWVIPQVAAVLDFGRLSYESLTAEGGHVVAFINIGVKDTQQSIMISEHWDVLDGKAKKLRVAYYDPKVLMQRLGRPIL